jgi:mono/diheme cytochrome c family protein
MCKKYPAFILLSALIFASGCNQNKPAEENKEVVKTKTDTVVVSQGINSKGIGRFTDVKLAHPLDEAMVGKGQTVYDSKCAACHKLTDEKLVGPGWKGVTDRRTPEWIMNFITNTQVMLDKDLAAQAEVVTCVVRMPNQDLTDEQARQVLEYMRKNDGKN